MGRVCQWVQAGSYAASDDRNLIAALWPGPATTGCAVAPIGGAMNVQIAPGKVAVPSQNNTGSSLCSSSAVEQVTLTPAAAQDRIDLVICRPQGADLDGGANTGFIFDVVTGVPAASPAVPATPAGTVSLAQVRVPTGSAAIVAGNITDVRPWGLAVAGATALPPPLLSGSTVQSFTDQSGEVWVAKNGVNGGAWKKARDVLSARWGRSAALTIGTGSTGINMDTVARDPYGLYVTGDRYSAPIPGWYLISGMVGFTPTAAGQYVTARLYINGGVLNAIVGAFSGISSANVGLAVPIYLNAGDYLQLMATAPNLALATATWTWFSMQYTGTG
jgi:hypothetical protein